MSMTLEDLTSMQLATDPIELSEWHNKINQEKTLEELKTEYEFELECD